MLDLTVSHWPYVAIFIAAIVEGEVVFVTACALAAMGLLNIWGVWFAAALGGSVGDQFFFYISRRRIGVWLRRIPGFSLYRDLLVGWIQQRATAMILICRFLPGLRILIPVSCAYAGVDPLRFSILNFVGGFTWAGVIVVIVSHLGPEALSWLGIGMTWAIVIMAASIVLILGVVRRWVVRRLEIERNAS
jgi:membrane protein DedA with SNARE-associated domain